MASETFGRESEEIRKVTKVHVIYQRTLNYRQNIKEVVNLWHKMEASLRVNWNWMR